ncbi:type II toxin-antitoxin system RelE/ParE family toxin [Halomonas salipaludis]|uniref:Type II toxin-antitoxin system mRNA interferase toxin, RelE/StbE family n=1 Tax=Halomonas salipaludis TaxID=2032625 RepID=A0A2A2ERW0_9GAMM|nr:type II toxin-antitoxin system RelE/ParE family toxin [Halomonas salipaludis]PAU75290.1 type II toxin-antitoxin system mRNA interferase toxin, RelE/StbE family [Halomonas salipaludis]
MLTIEWKPQARESLWTILNYLSDRNPYAALALQEVIEETVQALPQHPYLYRHGRVPGTREAVVHPNYLVVYRITTEHVAIIDVVHTRQRYPKLDTSQ